MHTQPMLSLRARVFYLIRRHDVELSETFARRCPEVATIQELNQFFHYIVSQLEGFSVNARSCLCDNMHIDDWLRHFEVTVLPELRRRRFPPITAKEVPSFYDIFSPGCAMA